MPYDETAYQAGLIAHALEISDDQQVPPEPVQLRDVNMKWAAVSCLQKAIRRNRPEDAIMAASALWNTSMREVVWRRLCVIGMEDCGLVSLEASSIAMMMDTQGVHNADLENVGFALVRGVIHEMCAQPKDRTIADGLLIPDYNHPEYELCRERLPPSTPARIKLMMDPNKALIARIAASTRVTSSAKGREALLQTIAVSDRARYASEHYSRLNHDNMWRNLLFLDAIAEGEAHEETDLDGTVEVQEIGGVPEFTWDRYVSLGKRSLRYLKKSYKPLKEFTEDIDPEDALDRLAWALFVVEGGRMDRVISYVGREDLAQLTVRGAAHKRGMSLAQAHDMCETMLENWDAVRHARQQVVANAQVYVGKE